MNKTILIILICLCSIDNAISQQDSLFFFKKDTVFITYDFPNLGSNIDKKYSKFKVDSKNGGLNTIYNLLDSINLKKKNDFNLRILDSPGIGASSNCDGCFGISFIHKNITLEYLVKLNKIKEDYIYKMLENQYLKKENVTIRDSIAFDEKIFKSVFKRYNLPLSRIMYRKKELFNKQIIHFDGSEKASSKLIELIKRPVYIFILENQYENKKYGVIKDIYYIFNEVHWIQPRMRHLYED